MARPGSQHRQMAAARKKQARAYAKDDKYIDAFVKLVFLPFTLPIKLLFGKKKRRR